MRVLFVYGHYKVDELEPISLKCTKLFMDFSIVTFNTVFELFHNLHTRERVLMLHVHKTRLHTDSAFLHKENNYQHLETTGHMPSGISIGPPFENMDR